MKKRQLKKKEVLVLTIVNALCAAFWIYDTICYAATYFEISEKVGGMPSLWLKVVAAVVWVIMQLFGLFGTSDAMNSAKMRMNEIPHGKRSVML